MMIDLFDERVRRHAHDLWEKAGKPHGRNDEFWYRARDEVLRLMELEATADDRLSMAA